MSYDYKLCMFTLNVAIAFIFAMAYSSNVLKVRQLNIPMVYDSHDFRILRNRENNTTSAVDALQRGACYDDVHIEEFYIEGFREVHTVSPVCQCLSDGFAPIWGTQSLEYTPRINAVKHTIGEIETINVDEIQTIIGRCQWKKPLTQSHQTSPQVNIVVVGAIYVYKSLAYNINMYVGWEKMRNGPYNAFHYAILVAFIYHITMTIVVFQEDVSSILIVIFSTLFITPIHTPLEKNSEIIIFLTYYILAIPTLIFMYNISHLHLNIVYNTVTVMIGVLIGLLTSVLLYCSTITDQKSAHRFTSDSCAYLTIIMVIVLSSIVPPRNHNYPQTYFSNVSEAFLIFLLVFPTIGLLSKTYVGNFTIQNIDFWLHKVVCIALIIDICLLY
jgi:hypothetical protein